MSFSIDQDEDMGEGYLSQPPTGSTFVFNGDVEVTARSTSDVPNPSVIPQETGLHLHWSNFLDKSLYNTF